VYSGEFRKGKRHGLGILKWPDGSTYKGWFTNGKRDGHGRYTFSDGGYYDGHWKDGQYDGIGGTSTAVRCSVFAQGPQSQSCLTLSHTFSFRFSLLPAPFVVLEYHWNDGRMYKGEWRAGMAHGRGFETNRDGSVRHNGHWIDDEPILVDDQ
jgi:hypothetical protein